MNGNIKNKIKIFQYFLRLRRPRSKKKRIQRKYQKQLSIAITKLFTLNGWELSEVSDTDDV